MKIELKNHQLFVLLILGGVLVSGCGGREPVANPKDPADAVETTLCADNATRDQVIGIVYTTRYGSTTGIVSRVGEVLCRNGYGVQQKMAADVTEEDLAGYDAVLIGSPVYSNFWLPEAMDLIERSADTLAEMPVGYINVNTTVRDPGKQDTAFDAYIQPVLDEFPGIRPVAVGIFAGEMDFEEMYDSDRFLMELVGFEEGSWVDLDAVEAWTVELVDTLEAL